MPEYLQNIRIKLLNYHHEDMHYNNWQFHHNLVADWPLPTQVYSKQVNLNLSNTLINVNQ